MQLLPFIQFVFLSQSETSNQMSKQPQIISLLTFLSSLVLLCKGYYIEEPLNYQTNAEHYPVHDERLISTKHRHFGHIPKPNRANPFALRHSGTVNVDEFGTKAYEHYPVHDGRLIKTKHRHFGLMPRPNNRATPFSLRQSGTVSVDDFGAKADGRDDSEAFDKAWNEACSRGATLVVPENRVYRLKSITFSGPCHPNTVFMIYGTIEAWTQMSAYEDRTRWIVFDSVTNFRVGGGGTFNGNGKKWWQSSCKTNNDHPCNDGPRPKAVTFYQCNNLKVRNLRFKDAPQMHVTFQSCFNVIVSNLDIRAPGDSPNTDGIHVADTQNIVISNSVIGTGDDCISIISGSQNVRATDITCGPGHGISIGSLGADNSEAEVSNVVVNRATLTGTSNGVRIKTWQGGSGYARNIKFLNIDMQNVTNPIIIDQYYCDQTKPCQEQGSAVHLSNVLYQNIKGTSASEVAIKFDCSRSVPCREIYLQDVILEPEGSGGTIATCDNVRYVNRGKFFPQCSPRT